MAFVQPAVFHSNGLIWVRFVMRENGRFSLLFIQPTIKYTDVMWDSVSYILVLVFEY